MDGWNDGGINGWIDAMFVEWNKGWMDRLCFSTGFLEHNVSL